MVSRGGWPFVQVGVLALWLGAAIFFGAAVAPALFAVLPSRALAGEVVGRVLPVIFYSGTLIGAAILVAEVRRRGGWSWRTAAPAAVMIAANAVAQFIVSPRI